MLGSSVRVATSLALGAALFFVPEVTLSRGLIELTRDLNETPAVSNRAGGGAARPTPVGDRIFFPGRDNDTGVELWVSDGTDAGTRRVLDIRPGPASSFPEEITDVGGVAFFVADDGTHGAELWRSDGTAEGTWLVRDIRRGPEESDTWCLAELNGVLLFNADDGIVASELWRSDGTPEGTYLVKDIDPGPGHGGPDKLIRVGDRIAFVASDDDHGRELWVTDGTTAGTQRVTDIYPGPTNSVFFKKKHDLIVRGNEVYFSAHSRLYGRALWKSDLTPEGTRFVAYVAPDGVTSTLPIASAGDDIYMVVGEQLWATGPSGENSRLIHEPIPEARSTVAVLGDRLFFAATPQPEVREGHQLWVTDGTSAGTQMLVDVFSSDACQPRHFVRNLFTFGDRVYFAGRMRGADEELWVSDGTVAGTHEVVDVVQDGGCKPRDFAALGDTLYFIADDGQTGFELWRSDGSAMGTMQVSDNFHSTEDFAVRGELVPWGDGVVFAGLNGVYWSDGSPEGTAPLPGAEGLVTLATAPVRVIGDAAFFWEQQADGVALWRADGTASGTERLETFPSVLGVSTAVLGEHLYFTTVASNETARRPGSLWRTDGRSVERIRDFTGPGEALMGGLFATSRRVLFAAATPEYDLELWRTDGTAEGTRLVRDVNPNGASLNPLIRKPVVAGDLVYFSGNDGVSGFELWRTDGTAEGTFQLVEFRPGPQAGTLLVTHLRGTPSGRLYFVRAESVGPDGQPAQSLDELWVTDGTPIGTRRLRTVEDSLFNSDLTVLGEDVYFVLSDPNGESVLWRSDGSISGTTVVAKHRYIDLVHATSRALYFTDDVYSITAGAWNTGIWTSDGTAAGTMPLAGPAGDFLQLQIRSLVDANGRLFLLGDDGVHGHEVMAVTCGNGQIDADEECDLGAANGTGSCSLACERRRSRSESFTPLGRRDGAPPPPTVRRLSGGRGAGRLPQR